MELRDLGKKIQASGRNTIDKTRNATERARLNSSISKLEKEIAQNYTTIGEIYYQKYSSNPPDQEMTPYFQEIANRLVQIQECNNLINSLKGTVQCINCGKEIDAEVLFCNFCGARQVPENSEINASVSQDFNETERGGQNITYIKKETEISTESVPEESEKSENPMPLFCKICGEKLVPGELFCPNCGEKVD